MIQIISLEQKKEYQEVVRHLTQSWEWGEFREKTGIKILRLGKFENKVLKNAWQVFFHKIPFTLWTVGYLPRPNIITTELLKTLTTFCRQNNAIFLRIEPLTTNLPQHSQFTFAPSKPILPTHTFLLDLTQSEEEILKNMHEKTRYNLRLAQKQGVEVKEKDDEKSLEIFLDFLIKTERRQGFYSHSKSYFREQWETLKPVAMIHLLLAYFDNEPISGILILRFKDDLYYAYGGSSETHREKMPNQLLHWEAIKLGKKLGCKTYDLWGAYLEKPESSDPWYGIYRFKAGFGGKLVSSPITFDLVINPLGYKLCQIADAYRWPLLKIKRAIQKFLIPNS